VEFMLNALVGVVLIAVAVPLYLRRIPRNGLYGVRFPATLASDDVWYPINQRGGRDMIAIGITYLGLLGVDSLFGSGWPRDLPFGMPAAFVVLALIVDAIILWRASENLKRQL